MKKSGNFDKTQNYLSSGRQNTENKGLYESPLSYPIKDISYASIEQRARQLDIWAAKRR